ncbi:MAG: Acetylornithine deacetylase, family [Bacteroidota bacterium]|jgi:acetylornithine deacetylase
MSVKPRGQEAIELLSSLIRISSFSSEEDQSAALIDQWLQARGVRTRRFHNNVYAVNLHEDLSKPYVLLNSHHDTVRPNKAYTRDPFESVIEEGKLYGLGSNDAGGALVALLSTFVHFYERKEMPYNIVMAASAEEETAGPLGLSALLKELPPIDLALVGEPTLLQMAVAEKGLIVYDATVYGTPSHAAHPNDDNAILNTVEVLEWFKKVQFERISETLGAVKTTVTQINAGKQHNVVPAQVDLVVDVRVTDAYTNEEIDAYFSAHAPCEMKARSLRLRSSGIPLEHDLVKAGQSMGMQTYGSPTLSDQAALTCPSIKLGPGDSLRSHSADEFIYVHEIESAIDTYIELLDRFFNALKTPHS